MSEKIKDELIEKLNNKEKGLRITHTLTQDKLLKTLTEHNGFLAPSLSISSPDTILNQYGDIIAIFEPEILFEGKLSTPKSDRINHVYSGDMYSPRFPRLEHDYVKKNNDWLYYQIEPFADKYFFELHDWDYKLKRGRDDLIYYLKDLAPLKCLFLSKEFPDFELKIIKEKKEETLMFKQKEFRSYLRKKQFDVNSKSFDLNELKDLIKFIIKEDLNRLERLGVDSEFIAQKKKDKEKTFTSFFEKEPLINGVNETIANMLKEKSSKVRKPEYTINTKKMANELNRILRKNKLEEKYEEFYNDIADVLYVNPHYKFGRQKLEPTEENILKIMIKEGAVASEQTLTHSLGKAKSLTNRRLLSLEDIIDTAEQDLSNKESIKQTEKEIKNGFHSVNDQIRSLNKTVDGFDLFDFTSQYIGSSSRKNENDIISTYERNGYKINEEIAKDLKELSSKLTNSKVEYFEAKLFRKVKIQEIKALVLPLNSKKEIKQLIKEKNIKAFYFKSNDETDKLRAMNKANKWLLNETYLEKLKTARKNKLKI